MSDCSDYELDHDTDDLRGTAASRPSKARASAGRTCCRRISVRCSMSLAKEKRQILAEYPSCYACDAAKTSMEHAPPKCFFPEETDEKGIQPFRRDLIKVPSCDRHNTEKSGDDVYALWHLAALDGVNDCGHMVRENLLRRIAARDWKERGGALMRRIANEIQEIDQGRPVGRTDSQRMIRFIRECAQAVYFFHTFKKLTLPLRVTNLSNDFRDVAKTEILQQRERSFDSEMGASEIHGANPDVFNYSISEKTEQGIILVRLVFYGTLKHWIFHHPNVGPQPST